jgi:hypothetical protein
LQGPRKTEGLCGWVVSGAAGIPVITAQETGAVPGEWRGLGTLGGLGWSVFKQARPLPATSAHDTGPLFREGDSRGAGLFRYSDQMMGDFIPQNAFRAWIRGEENVT